MEKHCGDQRDSSNSEKNPVSLASKQEKMTLWSEECGGNVCFFFLFSLIFVWELFLLAKSWGMLAGNNQRETHLSSQSMRKTVPGSQRVWVTSWRGQSWKRGLQFCVWADTYSRSAQSCTCGGKGAALRKLSDTAATTKRGQDRFVWCEANLVIAC